MNLGTVPLKRFNERHLRLIVWTLRIIVGLTFMMSGLVKAIDIFGFVFKIEEYLEVWQVAVPRSLTVMIAMIVSSTEFICGALTVTGCFKRCAIYILAAMMAVMLPLTAYIWAMSPVSDCGCFGDFLKLSNAATFWKNVGLSLMVVYLIGFNRRVAGVYRPYVQWAVLVVGWTYITAVCLYGYNVQPLLDFRSFPAGSELVSDAGADDEQAVFEYIYSRDGETRSFDIDNLPDSTWTFVDRKLVAGETADNLTVLSVRDMDGDDMTMEAISEEGDELIVVIPQYDKADLASTYVLNELQPFMEKHGGTMVALIAAPAAKIAEWRDLSMTPIPVYTAEETTLKELVRGAIGLVYLHDGRILWKRALSAVDVEALASGQIKVESYADRGGIILTVMSLILAAMLALIAMADMLRRSLSRRFFSHTK